MMRADDPKEFLLQLARLMISEKGSLFRVISIAVALLLGAFALRIAAVTSSPKESR
jgi:hypothetical protein